MKRRIQIWFARKATRRLLRCYGTVFLGIMAISIVGIIVLHLPFISVQSIVVSPKSDIEQVLRSEILAHAKQALRERRYGVPGKTRYFFNQGAFEQMLREQFPRADAIAIESGFLNKWYIIAKRRNSFGTYCDAAHCLIIDTQGFAFMETNIRVGNPLHISGTLQLGEYIFDTDKNAVADFKKIPEIVSFLEDGGMSVRDISFRRDTRVVHVALENNIGVWLDASEALYDTTRALHIVFEEVFTDPSAQAEIVSVDVRNPLSILYEKK